jgi:hypothetical protein
MRLSLFDDRGVLSGNGCGAKGEGGEGKQGAAHRQDLLA